MKIVSVLSWFNFLRLLELLKLFRDSQTFYHILNLNSHQLNVSCHFFFPFISFHTSIIFIDIKSCEHTPHTSHQNHILFCCFLFYFQWWNILKKRDEINVQQNEPLKTQWDQVENWIERVTIYFLHTFFIATWKLQLPSQSHATWLTVWNNWRYLSFTLSSFLKMSHECLAWYSY